MFSAFPFLILITGNNNYNYRIIINNFIKTDTGPLFTYQVNNKLTSLRAFSLSLLLIIRNKNYTIILRWIQNISLHWSIIRVTDI